MPLHELGEGGLVALRGEALQQVLIRDMFLHARDGELTDLLQDLIERMTWHGGSSSGKPVWASLSSVLPDRARHKDFLESVSAWKRAMKNNAIA
jgi:hypothetical protein